ncbi:MAG TPA: sigma-54 dependent transcriptional regulator [Ktedonobacterales bacterium]
MTAKTKSRPATILGGRILVADDDLEMRAQILRVLKGDGHQIDFAGTAAEVLSTPTLPDAQRPDLILLSIQASSLGGQQVLERLNERQCTIPIIVMTDIPKATIVIRAVQLGAIDYLLKPCTDETVRHIVKRAIERVRHGEMIEPSALPPADPHETMVGSTPVMIEIFKLIGSVAPTNATVLITGETGTGKELVAEALHHSSPRRAGPFVRVNCAALPETLLESELFGHEKGSFTGALTQHKGRFEMAHRGTILLDEIGELTLGTQKKLLRVLQEHEFERVGSTTPIQVDVRVIAATHRNLHEEVKRARFREDLFYRLNVVAIDLPPLRERVEDIPALVAHFLNIYRYKPTVPSRISVEALKLLDTHRWPGNVRELENLMHRAVVLAQGGAILPEHVRFHHETNPHIINVVERVKDGLNLEAFLDEVRQLAIKEALDFHGGDRYKAADQLGVKEAELDPKPIQVKPSGPGMRPQKEAAG